MDMATAISLDGSPDVAPFPGCFTVCLECGTVAVFGETLQLRFPNKLDCRNLIETPGILRGLEQIAAARKVILHLRAARN